MHRFVALVIAALLPLTACSHSVTIDSDPPGAKIKVNGSYVGEGPAVFTETTGWDKSYEIVAEPAGGGFKNTRRTVRQTEWNGGVVATSVALTVCSFGIGFPALLGLAFSRQLPDQIIVSLEEGSDKSDSDSDGGEPVDDYGY